MIKATELRIGNLVLFSPSGKVAKVNERVVCVSEINKDSCIISDIEYGGVPIELFYNSASIQPIKLNEDWLIRMGFKILHNKRLEKTVASIDYFFLHLWDEWTYTTQELNIEIKYVHQLQNLFFALTGEELTIK